MFDPAKNPTSTNDSYGESGESTPPLWKTSPNHPRVRPNQYRNLSPETKTQAIVKGQMELMEMVARMPESHYELSLKDLVERPFRHQKSFMEEQEIVRKKKKNNEKKLEMNRNGGIELKMGFWVSDWGSSKKKKKKVLPKQAVEVAGEGGGEEWWKKRYVESAGKSENVGLSGSSSGSFKSSNSSSSKRSSSRCVLNFNHVLFDLWFCDASGRFC